MRHAWAAQAEPAKLPILHFGLFHPRMVPVRSEELIRLLRRYARSKGLAFSVVRRRGKGSHVMICVGDKRSFVPHSRELPDGTRQAVLRQLGVSLNELQTPRTQPRPQGT